MRNSDEIPKFWRRIVRLVERNSETGRIGIDETESGLLRLARLPGPHSEPRLSPTPFRGRIMDRRQIRLHSGPRKNRINDEANLWNAASVSPPRRS
jgi:hypothetical protein